MGEDSHHVGVDFETAEETDVSPRRDGDTRQAILAAALELACSRGFDHATLQDVAQRVGVTSAALYYYFESKDALLRALIEPLLDEVDDLVGAAETSSTITASGRQLLARYLDILIRQRQVVLCALQDPAVLHHEDLGGRLKKQRAQLRHALAGSNDGDASVVAAAAALGAIHQPVIDLEDADLAKLRQSILEAATRALQTARESREARRGGRVEAGGVTRANNARCEDRRASADESTFPWEEGEHDGGRDPTA